MLGYEGLVLKDPESPYTPGRRGKSWVKLKEELDTLDVVIVGAELGHGKRAGKISDYTFAVRDGESLKVIGKAYSGLTDKEIEEMMVKIKALTIEDDGYFRTGEARARHRGRLRQHPEEREARQRVRAQVPADQEDPERQGRRRHRHHREGQEGLRVSEGQGRRGSVEAAELLRERLVVGDALAHELVEERRPPLELSRDPLRRVAVALPPCFASFAESSGEPSHVPPGPRRA